MSRLREGELRPHAHDVLREVRQDQSPTVPSVGTLSVKTTGRVNMRQVPLLSFSTGIWAPEVPIGRLSVSSCGIAVELTIHTVDRDAYDCGVSRANILATF